MRTYDLLRRALTARVSDVLPDPTPLDRMQNLSDRLSHPVFLKREDLTPVFSFKLRGAYNRITALSPDELARGVIAASAGNHAQGVAFAARKLGISCRIVMPRTTPSIKVLAVKRLGATIDLAGDSYSDAAEYCAGVARTTGAVPIPPYDDLEVIAGQGTIALEILRQAPRDLGSIFVPIGGGGLVAGIAGVVKELRPDVRVVGVQSEDSDAMKRSLAAGKRVRLDRVGIFSDGTAVKQVGEITFDICRNHVDEILTVTTDEICAGIQDAFLDTRTILEPAGALAVAGVKKAALAGLPPGPAVAIGSGANVPFAKLGYVAERAEVGQLREAIFVVTIPERPGSFLAFCEAVGERAVTEFNYRLASRAAADVFVGVEVSGPEEAAQIASRLQAGGYRCDDLSNDDFAKTHVRHMVGGRSANARNEVLYSFEFPERPGALLEFLKSLGARWNISLFHYRNHGSAYGRVLCGLEVPEEERALLRQTLDGLGFPYEDETASVAARLLIGGE
ncbi:MAG TPA: threonine ammonia-lyase, biosynthetic [Polyangiaceae bacterium]|nr:threonine ammonia-lyase, biosynthetic [Polyangiaceae bacterium]